MKSQNIEEGKIGENIAKKHLVGKGFRFIESNYRLRGGEIDLICEKSGRLIFVEVKLKIGDRFGSPEEMINKAKINQVRKIAQVYLSTKPELSKKFPIQRIDAVCIVLNEDRTVKRVSHHENIGYEMG